MDPLSPIKSLRGHRVTLDGFNFGLVEHVVLTPEASGTAKSLVPVWISDDGRQLQFLPPVTMALGSYAITITGTGYDSIAVGRLTLVPVASLDAMDPPARDASAYADMLTELLPKGPAWTRKVTSNLRKLFLALGTELARIHDLGAYFLRETSPANTTDFLDEWEKELGLPIVPSAPITGTDARREEVFRKARSLGGCSPAYFEELAAIFGYNVVIEEMFDGASPFKAGISRAGDALTQGLYLFTFKATVYGLTTQDVFLEAMLRSIKPAHTAIFFDYPTDTITQTLDDSADAIVQTLDDADDAIVQTI